MTCKGYDPKAVKVGKSVKRLAANYTNDHQRAAFVKSYVRILEAENRQRGARNRGEK
jgi:hypothetical protein